MEILKIENLTVEINGNVILDRINLSINKGEIVAIVGPNGGGKTTLLKSCLGFIKPKKGNITILSKSPKEVIKTGKTGYLPQKQDLTKESFLSALDIVLFGLVNKKLSKKEKKETALNALKQVSMDRFAYYPFSKLSGGQQQRVSIARVIVQKPKIVFFDEPSTGVDVVAQEGFYEFIKKLRDETGLTIVMVSHDIGVIGSFVDRVVGLNKYLHYLGDIRGFLKRDILEKLYGAEVKLLIHSPECVSCENFHLEFRK